MNDIKDILEQIQEIWNNYIFKLKFFRNYYKFDEATSSNHFGQILDHFDDSLCIVQNAKTPELIEERYAFNISLLQTLYVQQDLIEEMHRIFKTNVNKGHLYKDLNYKTNRELRNELVGHPIRRENGNGIMISSVTLSYHNQPNTIEYVRYHNSNGYAFEKIQYSVEDVISRHHIFLKDNLNLIFVKIHKPLNKYLRKVEEIQNVLKQGNFDAVVRLTEAYYESFQDENYLYNSNQIKAVFDLKSTHPRYQFMIDSYLFDLEYHLNELVNKIESITKNKERKMVNYPINISEHHYEIGKLFTKRNFQDFDFYGGILKNKLIDNKEAIKELNFMELNILDEVNYYSSCNYLNKILTN
jgi:hypothetical protein